MSNTRKTQAFFFLLLGLLALILLASGLSSLQLLPAQRFVIDNDEAVTTEEITTAEEIDPEAGARAIQNTLLALFIIFLPISLIVAFRSPELFKEVLKRDIRLFLFVLAGFFLFRQLQLQGFFNRPSDLPGTTAIGIPSVIQNPTVLMGFGLAFLLLGVFVYSLWKLWRRFSPLFSLSKIAQDAIEEIQSGVDLRNAIIRCYFEMCRALQGTGRLERSKAIIFWELAQQLADVGIAAEQTQRLTRLFEKVRYGAETLGKNEEQEAIECLKAIVQDIDERKNRRPDPFLKPKQLPPLGKRQTVNSKQ